MGLNTKKTSVSGLRLIVCGCMAMVTTMHAGAQSSQEAAPPPPSDSSIYTLHVYADLLEIPTLVLKPNLAATPPLLPDQFNISLDSGPVFHPTQVQIEGDRPIHLAVLLDPSGSAGDFKNSLRLALLDIAARSLGPSDRLSLYIAEGACVRSVKDVPATDTTQISSALKALYHSPRHRGENKQLQCGKSVKLWNAIGTAAEALADSPGERVLIVLSNGKDTNSTLNVPRLRQFCTLHSIAVFGVVPAFSRAQDPNAWMQKGDNPFRVLTQTTGGIILFDPPFPVPLTLMMLMRFVRGRYILEFPRPQGGAVGAHIIDVKVTDADDIVRPAGIAYAPPDAALLSAPTTIQGPSSPAVFGNRTPLEPQPH